jgi:hypothetical protein
MKPPEQLYKYHVANLRQVQSALSRLFLSLRVAVAAADGPTTAAFTRVGILLLACWAEARLSKLLFEREAFSKNERDSVAAEPTQLDRWLRVVEIGFRRHYQVPSAPLSSATLPHSAAARYRELLDLLNAELSSVIQLRNRLAHGQWKYPLNASGNEVVATQFQALQDENVLSLQFKQRLLASLAEVVHDLAVSKSTFERDFDRHFKQIVDTRRDLTGRKYSDYVAKMQLKLKRGVKVRNSPTVGP